MYAYVGSFNYTGSEGIHLCEYSEESGGLTYIKTMYPQVNAGNLRMYQNLLLATDESESGYVYCFEADPKTGELTQRSCTPTLGVNPSYITIDSGERYVIVTHFAVGAPVKIIERTADGCQSRLRGNDSPTCLYRLDQEKGLGELLDVGLHAPENGFMTMLHKAYESPDHSFFAENDLGDNQIYFFRIENERLHYISKAAVGQGDEGPRHGAFHPTLPCLYLNYEHKSRISRLDLSDLSHVAVVEELELFEPGETLAPEDNQSEIMFSPDGKILYNFMRGKGIAYVIEVDEKDGSMRLKQRLPLPGNDPRGAQFSPDEKHILVEGHNTGMVYTLDIQEDGTLCYRGKACAMAHPACIAFYEDKETKKLLTEAAAGDREVCATVAEMYLHGQIGAAPDYKRAYDWAKRAEDAKQGRAYTVLGIICLNGYQRTKSYEEAERFLTMAVEAGDMKAPRYVGQMYAEGLGKEINWSEAQKWYQLGASRGDVSSMYMLGKIYEEGLGVQPDLETAVSWYQKSAKRDDHVGRPSREALKRLNIPLE